MGNTGSARKLRHQHRATEARKLPALLECRFVEKPTGSSRGPPDLGHHLKFIERGVWVIVRRRFQDLSNGSGDEEVLLLFQEITARVLF